MKKIIYPTISLVPNLIEYVYTKEEEMDIDKFQEKKCINFKKMMLESVNPRDSIYIPVPTGYDDILVMKYSKALFSHKLLITLLSFSSGSRRMAIAASLCLGFHHLSNWILYCQI